MAKVKSVHIVSFKKSDIFALIFEAKPDLFQGKKFEDLAEYSNDPNDAESIQFTFKAAIVSDDDEVK